MGYKILLFTLGTDHKSPLGTYSFHSALVSGDSGKLEPPLNEWKTVYLHFVVRVIWGTHCIVPAVRRDKIAVQVRYVLLAILSCISS
jgi:hypothetical protein